MQKKMIKVLWIFLIFVLTSNTKGIASAVDISLSIASFPIVSTDCDSTDLSASSNKVHSSNKLSGYCRARQNFSCVIPLKLRGKKGRYEFSSISSYAGFPFPVFSRSLDGRGKGKVTTVIPAHANIRLDSPLSRGAWGGCVWAVPLTRGIKGVYAFSVIPVPHSAGLIPTGIQLSSSLPSGARVGCVSSVPPDKVDKGGYAFAVIFSHAGFSFPVFSPSLDGRDKGRVKTSIFHSPIQRTRRSPQKNIRADFVPFISYTRASTNKRISRLSIDIKSTTLSDIFIPPK